MRESNPGFHVTRVACYHYNYMAMVAEGGIEPRANLLMRQEYALHFPLWGGRRGLNQYLSASQADVLPLHHSHHSLHGGI